MAVDWDWTRVVFDHVKITVQDTQASVAFYKTVLEPLSIPPIWENDRGAQLANLVVSGGGEQKRPHSRRVRCRLTRAGRRFSSRRP